VITYEDLGKRIGEKINSTPIDDDYKKCFWKDFSEVLMDFTVILPELQKPIITDILIESFKPKELCKKFWLKDLYSKTIASYCADFLSKSFNPSKSVYSCKHSDMGDTDILVSHDFSNGNGIFQVARKIFGGNAIKGNQYNGVTYLIQYQAGFLKKGLIMHRNLYNKYYDWIASSWVDYTFDINNTKLYEYEDKPEGYYYYYSRYYVLPNQSIREIVTLMAQHIDDEVSDKR
jgi:hypothetical protein